MLTRPGLHSGPEWMRYISDSFSDPEHASRILMPFWAFFVIYMYMIACMGLTHFVTAVILSKDCVFESRARIAGLPLIWYSPVAHGIIALGGRATGVIALGEVAVGFIAIGGLSLGVFAVGGMSLGLLTFGILSIGWRAFGGLAIGQTALGGFAVGKYAYAGNGVA